MDPRQRRLVARVVAPLAFLAAATLAVVVARPAFDEDEGAGPAARTTAPATTATTATTTAPATTAEEPPPATTEGADEPADATYHVVESGDTLAAIADEYGTTVEALVDLNPGIDPVALTIGQRVRVG